MTAARIHPNREARTAHPPLPRQPTMREWLSRDRRPWWQRLLSGAEGKGQ